MIYIAPNVYIDTGVLRDILEKRKSYPLFLQELASGGEYRLITTIITLYETFLSESRKFREGKDIGVDYEVLIDAMKNRILLFIKVARIEGLMLSIPGVEVFSSSATKAFDLMRQYKMDPTDALHVAFACEYKTDYFTTYDNGILKLARKSEFFDRYGVQILRSESLVPVIYERLDKVRGKDIKEYPPCIEVIYDVVKKGNRRLLEQELLLLVNFLRRCLNYNSENIHKTLKNMINYNRVKTESALQKYPPLIWFCEDVKLSIPNACPYSTKSMCCRNSNPLSEDMNEDIIRIRLTKTKNSPFYHYIRKVTKI